MGRREKLAICGIVIVVLVLILALLSSIRSSNSTIDCTAPTDIWCPECGTHYNIHIAGEIIHIEKDKGVTDVSRNPSR